MLPQPLFVHVYDADNLIILYEKIIFKFNSNLKNYFL